MVTTRDDAIMNLFHRVGVLEEKVQGMGTPEPMTVGELRQRIITAIEDRFVRTLEVKPDEDVPALADEILRLLDEAEVPAVVDDFVPKTWDGLMQILDSVYPETIFPTLMDDPSRDAGPRIVSALRQINQIRRNYNA